MEKSKILKLNIKWCLENKPNTRNSDKLLWLSLLKNFYYLDQQYPFTENRFIDYILRVPSEDAVKRIRAAYNHAGEYLPTDPKIIKKRRLEAKKWNVDLGYSTQEVAIDKKEQAKLDIKEPWWLKD